MNNKPVRLLYLGNILSHQGYTKGVIETLGLQLQQEGFQVAYAGKSRFQIFRLLEMLISIVKHWRSIDYVLIDSYSTKAFWYLVVNGYFCHLLGLRFIPILHGGNFEKRLSNMPRISRWIFGMSFTNVAVSEFLENVFRSHGIEVRVIHNNLPIKQYKYRSKSSIGPNILWVRSFHDQYNPNMAAKVLEIIKEHYSEANLCMVGPDKDGSMSSFENYIQNNGLANRVKITGLLSKKQWHSLADGFDFFINTTNVDNTPVSVMEAMALGLVVVSTNVGGMPFLIRHNVDGLLVGINDHAGMADAILEILREEQLGQNMALSARNKVESWDWSIVRTKWLNLLVNYEK